MPHVPLTERYHCHVGCPVQVCCNARHPYNFLPLTGVFPHVKNVISLPSGVHVVAVSAIGTNRASSVAMVKFNVAGKDTAGVCRHENACELFSLASRSSSKLFWSCAWTQSIHHLRCKLSHSVRNLLCRPETTTAMSECSGTLMWS